MPEKATFIITPPNTTISITRSLNLLTNLHQQDLFQYQRDFFETAKLCGWNEQAQSDVLNEQTSSELLQRYHGKITTYEKFHVISEEKYPEQDAITYYNQFNNIKKMIISP